MGVPSIQPIAERLPKLSQVQRVINTFSSPSKTFKDIKKGHKSWWLPFVIYVLISYVFFSVINLKVGMHQIVENQIHASPKTEERLSQLPTDQREKQMDISITMAKVAFLASPVIWLISGLIISLVLWGTINFGFGGKATFGSVLSVWIYAMIPSAIKMLLGGLVLFVGVVPEGFDVKNFSPTNLGVLFNPQETNAALYSLASSLDVISLWSLFLLAIGLAIVAGVKRKAGVIAVFGWWAVVTMFSMGWAAITG